MQNTIPFFSIITVVRNDLTGLTVTEQSISTQEYSNFEWIVIDGNSTDGTISFLKELDNPRLHWISETDGGIFDAMNKGISLAKGTYLVFLNAGDLFPEDRTLINVAAKLKGANVLVDVLFGGAEFIMPHGTSVYRAPKPLYPYILHGLPGNHQATYYKNEILQRARYDVSFKISGDYYLISKLYSLGITSSILDEALVRFRVGDTSFQNPIRLIRESHRVQRDVLKLNGVHRFFSTCKKVIAISALYLIAKGLIPEKILKIKGEV